MPKIVIENLDGKEINAPERKSLLRVLQENRIDWMQSCGGKGRCTTCKAVIVKGAENLSPVTSAEWRYRGIKALGDDERLSCQSAVLGDLVIRVPDVYKLPHVRYSD